MDLEFMKGDYFSQAIPFDVYVNGVFSYHYDLTGKTVLFTMKRLSDVLEDDSQALISKTITSHTDPTNGITTLEIVAADWSSVPLGTHKCNFKVMDGIKPMSSNTFYVNVVESVTKRTS
jgi:hypothetical protein